MFKKFSIFQSSGNGCMRFWEAKQKMGGANLWLDGPKISATTFVRPTSNAREACVRKPLQDVAQALFASNYDVLAREWRREGLIL
jgi:hypothetical protein